MITKKEYKKLIHKMVDSIENEDFLKRIYSFTLVKYQKEIKEETQHD